MHIVSSLDVGQCDTAYTYCMCACVCMCACMCACVCMCACMCACVYHMHYNKKVRTSSYVAGECPSGCGFGHVCVSSLIFSLSVYLQRCVV